MRYKLIMENWRKFVSEQSKETEAEGPMSMGDEEGDATQSPGRLTSIESDIKGTLRDIVPKEFLRPLKHSIVLGKGPDSSGFIINAEHMKENPARWILGKNSDNADEGQMYSDTHWGTTELIAAVRGAIKQVHSVPDEVYSARLVKMFLGEVDTEITEKHKGLIPMFQEFGWIPKKTGPLYLEDFSVKPYFTDAYGNTYHGQHQKGKGKIVGHASHQNGTDADIGLYMLPGYEMRDSFPRNVVKGKPLVLNFDNANVAGGEPSMKKVRSLQGGAMPPKNTWHLATGYEGNWDKGRNGKRPSIFDPELFPKRFDLLEFIEPEDLTAEGILDLLYRDFIQRNYRGDREAESFPEFDGDLERKAHIITKAMGLEHRGNFSHRHKRESHKINGKVEKVWKKRSSSKIVRRMIGTIDSERTWQLIKGLKKGGAVVILIDDELIPVLKAAALRAGDDASGMSHWPNHRNHIHVRVDAKKSNSIGRKLSRKLISVVKSNRSIVQKVKKLARDEPKVVEKFYEKELKDIPGWKWSSDIRRIFSSGIESIKSQSTETWEDFLNLINIGDYASSSEEEKGPGPWRDD